MRKVTIHNNNTTEERLLENLQLSPQQRMKKLFELMQLSALFKKDH